METQTPQEYWDEQIYFAEKALDYAIRQRRLVEPEVPVLVTE